MNPDQLDYGITSWNEYNTSNTSSDFWYKQKLAAPAPPEPDQLCEECDRSYYLDIHKEGEDFVYSDDGTCYCVPCLPEDDE